MWAELHLADTGVTLPAVGMDVSEAGWAVFFLWHLPTLFHLSQYSDHS